MKKNIVRQVLRLLKIILKINRNWNYLNTCRKIWRKIRRPLIYHFRPRYTILSLLLRKGECKSCSCCGGKTRFFDCAHLNENKSCAVHHTLKQPWDCMITPIDYKDLDPYGRKCGYYWDKKDLKILKLIKRK